MAEAKFIASYAQNIEDINSEEMGYIKAILSSIEVLAVQPCEPDVIVRLARCARYLAVSLEDNVSYQVEQIANAHKGMH